MDAALCSVETFMNSWSLQPLFWPESVLVHKSFKERKCEHSQQNVEGYVHSKSILFFNVCCFPALMIDHCCQLLLAHKALVQLSSLKPLVLAVGATIVYLHGVRRVMSGPSSVCSGV